MKRLRALVTLLVSSVLLSSCGLLPHGGVIFDSSDQRADVRMEQIAEALNEQDLEALKNLFSPYALEQAEDIDGGIEYLLSFFPHGGVTWERNAVNSSGKNQAGKKSEVLLAVYKVSADGADYELFFADFTVNEVVNPDNVGIYAMGVTPWTDDPREGASEQFGDWASAIRLETNLEAGYPGIYIPREDYVSASQLADARMEQITSALNSQDAAALTALFSERAQDEATEFDLRLMSLLSLFPSGGVTWERQVVNTSADEAEANVLRTAQYRLFTDSKDYWLFFADFTVNADPESVGLASLALTPWTEPGASDQDEAFDEWSSAWIFDGAGPAGIYVPAD